MLDQYYFNGEFVNNKRHGQGKMTTTLDTYSGMWVGEHLEGPGKIEWSNGCIMVGNFKQSLLEGFGYKLYPLKDNEIS